jgi:peroxiredoxin
MSKTGLGSAAVIYAIISLAILTQSRRSETAYAIGYTRLSGALRQNNVSEEQKTAKVRAGSVAPDFTLPAESKPLHLSQWDGRKIVLFFFCGCSWCQDVARQWGQLQSSDALLSAPSRDSAGTAKTSNGRKASKPVSPDTLPPITIIVYSGDIPEARAFAKNTGLVTAQTILLSDKDNEVTDNLYNTEPCPRVFVIDSKRIVRYVNDNPDDQPRQAPAELIVAKTLSAVRSLAVK